MNEKDAFKILGVSGDVTKEMIKDLYRKACTTYHPDRNPAGLEMMQLVNVAYNVIKNFDGLADIASDVANYGKDINEALNKIITLSLDIEVCGAWIWVNGDTKTHKETLKEAGFKYAPKKQQWYYRPADYKCFNRKQMSMIEIRTKYGSDEIKTLRYTQLAS